MPNCDFNKVACNSCQDGSNSNISRFFKKVILLPSKQISVQNYMGKSVYQSSDFISKNKYNVTLDPRVEIAKGFSI